MIYVDVDETLYLPADGCFVPRDPNYPLIEKIKEWHSEGRDIIVWTSNSAGVQWAKDAVKNLGLEPYVKLCLPKPHTIVDDDHLEYYHVIDPITLTYKK